MHLPLLATLVPSLLPSFSTALVGISWNFKNVPPSGLTDVTFPISMSNAVHKSGYYFAIQFSFMNVPKIGYTGLQPRPDVNGKPIVHGVFSSFNPGTTTSDPQRYYGADGGPGIRCAVDVEGSYDDVYHCVVDNIGGDAWRGTLINTRTRKRTHIGEWTLPANSGGIKKSQVGFVEWYPWNGYPVPHICRHLPSMDIMFGLPRSYSGIVVAELNPYTYGECKYRGEDVQYKRERAVLKGERPADAELITVGFKDAWDLPDKEKNSGR